MAWADDGLIDLVDGQCRYDLDGTTKPGDLQWGYNFDDALPGPDGLFILMKRRGTVALLVDGRQPLRQLNRDYYRADRFDYPATLFREPGGRVLLAHCPDLSFAIHLDDARTGERLTSRVQSRRTGLFHSRLAASPSGRWLASAGWAWQPWDTGAVFDVDSALASPAHLDSVGIGLADLVPEEIGGVAWTADDHLLVFTVRRGTIEAERDEDEDTYVETGGIGCLDVAARAWCFRTPLDWAPGEVFDLGDHRHVVGLNQFPRLLDARAGTVLQRWDDLAVGRRDSSLEPGDRVPLAVDPRGRRFAVITGGVLSIISLG